MCNMILVLDYWNKNFLIYPDYINWVLMISLILDTRCRDDRYVILIEDVALHSYYLDYSWVTMVGRILCSLFVILVFIVLVDLKDIFSISWLVLDYFIYSVIEIEYCDSDFIDINDNIYIQSSTAVTVDLSYWWPRGS